MTYLVLARRFRPQTFEEIVGQEHVTQTLQNAIRSGRVAHAFLFAGARGVGKTTAARVLAKALNCAEGPTERPCGVCDQCVGVAESRAVDVQEIDGASNNSVDDVRALRETVPYRPASARYKIYIVDEVHMLTTSAFNALLKTLEEPPEHVKFVFATTEPHKIPVTILSRCQRYDFRLVPTSLILQRLHAITSSEGVDADQAALSLLAREAEGSMRDALSLLDQALAFDARRLRADEVARFLGVADRQLLLQISGAVLQGDAASALRAVESAATHGCDLTRFAHDLLRHLRNLVVIAQCPGDRDLIDISDVEVQELAAQVEGRDAAELHRLFLLFSRASEEVARSQQPRLVLEMTLARLSSLEPMASLADLSRRLEQLGAGRTPRGAPQAATERRGAAPAAATMHAPTRAQQQSTAPNQAHRTRADETPSLPRHGDASDGADAAEDDPATLWKRVLAEVERTSSPLYHLVRQARLVEASPTRLSLVLPDAPFIRDEVKSQTRRDALATAFESVTGSRPEVKLEVGKGSEMTAFEHDHIEKAARRQDRRQEASSHAAVRASLRVFDGSQLDIKLVDDDK